MTLADRKPFALTSGITVRENQPMLRFDQRWVAFESQQSGIDEVYIAPFPKGARRRVSNGGGDDPRWKADGRELYYLAPNGDMMAVPISGSDTAEPSTPIRLFATCTSGSIQRPGPPGSRGFYDVTPDGSRFLLACGSPSSNPSVITVSVDWAASIK
jgi:Tol biopolymer transport system component